MNVIHEDGLRFYQVLVLPRHEWDSMGYETWGDFPFVEQDEVLQRTGLRAIKKFAKKDPILQWVKDQNAMITCTHKYSRRNSLLFTQVYTSFRDPQVEQMFILRWS